LLQPGQPTKIPTGLRIAPPEHLWCRIIGRSSTIWKYNIQILEGVIDTGWRGELFMVGINHGKKEIIVERGVRLAQIIFHQKVDVVFIYAYELPESERGTRGFGSSGR
jgi:dUTP pyrophosphatase